MESMQAEATPATHNGPENADIPDVLDALCGARQVLDLVADKWAILAIYALGEGTRRTGDLQRRLGGISPKVLTETVRRLERNGLVLRRTYPVVPPKVEYSLTPLGRTLLLPLNDLCQWAERHLDDVEVARVRYESVAD
jgi:DNA-binding HxlR family transcriptional regulator